MITKTSSKLSPKERKELMLDLCRGLVVLNSVQEVADALTDLLSPKEVETIAKRLKIAEYLVQGKDYSFIRGAIKVGFSTIARVNTWLNISGEGFKVMLSRKKKSPKEPSEQERFDPYSWRNIKRRYSLNFWPILVLEELMKTSDRKEKNKIQEVFEKLDLKGKSFNRWSNRKLYQMFSSERVIKEGERI